MTAVLAGVHDSFWTHAGTVDELGRQLRRTFVELHRQPLLERLVADLKTYSSVRGLHQACRCA